MYLVVVVLHICIAVAVALEFPNWLKASLSALSDLSYCIYMVKSLESICSKYRCMLFHLFFGVGVVTAM
jgi:surface polysaccharide O-acyltransferase-like enzyme